MFGGVKLSNSLDYVSGWYVKAAELMLQNDAIKAAFVSTNSICQGEQVFPIWSTLQERFGIHIDFAWKTFVWNNDTPNGAHVHCVIIGFSRTQSVLEATLFTTDKLGGRACRNISPYLRDMPSVLVASTSKPIEPNSPVVKNGSKPTDGGWYLFTPEEKEDFVKREPRSESLFRPWVGSEEFIKGKERWCLYLGDKQPEEISGMPLVVERVKAVRAVRLGEGPNAKGKRAAKKPPAPTRKSADTPMRFFHDNVQTDSYLVIPKVSSERRDYVPIGFMGADSIASDLVTTVEHATIYDFGILTSQFHNAWMRAVAGRLKSDYRYTPSLVYNTFVWPSATAEQRIEIEQCAQAVLDARDAHPGKSLADLYDPDKMPSDLRAAHHALDAAVERAYDVEFEGDEEKMVAHLFKLYAEAIRKV